MIRFNIPFHLLSAWIWLHSRGFRVNGQSSESYRKGRASSILIFSVQFDTTSHYDRLNWNSRIRLKKEVIIFEPNWNKKKYMFFLIWTQENGVRLAILNVLWPRLVEQLKQVLRLLPKTWRTVRCALLMAVDLLQLRLFEDDFRLTNIPSEPILLCI